MPRQRLLTLVVLVLAFSAVSTLCEAKSKRLHVTAQIAQLTFTGDPDSPQLGDRSIGNADLVDESGTSVGTAVSSCTIISVPPQDTRDECLLTAVFAEGQIMYGGVAPTAAIVRVVVVGTSVQWGILGGTGDFRRARGDVTAIVTAPGIFDITYDLD
jgi:type IV secretory pathway VirB2 component (pilin)